MLGCKQDPKGDVFSVSEWDSKRDVLLKFIQSKDQKGGCPWVQRCIMFKFQGYEGLYILYVE